MQGAGGKEWKPHQNNIRTLYEALIFNSIMQWFKSGSRDPLNDLGSELCAYFCSNTIEIVTVPTWWDHYVRMAWVDFSNIEQYLGLQLVDIIIIHTSMLSWWWRQNWQVPSCPIPFKVDTNRLSFHKFWGNLLFWEHSEVLILIPKPTDLGRCTSTRLLAAHT